MHESVDARAPERGREPELEIAFRDVVEAHATHARRRARVLFRVFAARVHGGTQVRNRPVRRRESIDDVPIVVFVYVVYVVVAHPINQSIDQSSVTRTVSLSSESRTDSLFVVDRPRAPRLPDSRAARHGR